ncbi:putative retrotransposon hot spot protein 4 (RHS4) [Trypanosoma vivax]|uniref:Retrotransposon hot spot protein,C-terminal domain-containing protein n=1 Tax=Trypanosoma vivax (strain Y486) TaxID=1055687 RepID=F9WMF1_TRYVY|nr:putative retrotransposon hot spot protein 4 (RHS4) [Trypanosoma vivax]CCD18706.1 hypothetical protein, conserved in T. vivax [Trypanosoma vivax Y486]|eukprot:CCD18706.1 hypothetical protein, conserved in T. vivax [Trypanosoma vivax Y486]
MDQKWALLFYINCYNTREMKAFFARQEWCLCVTAERYQASLAEIEQRWSVVKQRIEEVGPLPRYVFDLEKYAQRCDDVAVALLNIKAEDMERYMRILLCSISWVEDGTTHKIIKLVRVASDPADRYLNFLPLRSLLRA